MRKNDRSKNRKWTEGDLSLLRFSMFNIEQSLRFSFLFLPKDSSILSHTSYAFHSICGTISSPERFARFPAVSFDDLYVFDPSSLTWTNATATASGPAPSGRSQHGFAASSGRLYVHGGTTGDDIWDLGSHHPAAFYELSAIEYWTLELTWNP